MAHKGRSLFSRLLGNWSIIGLVVFTLLCLWRLPYAADLRPPIEFGMTALDLAMAWLPEGVLLGIGAFFAHRIGREPGDPASGSVIGFLFYLCLWLVIWGLAVFLPGWLLFCSLAEVLKPLKDVFLLGGLGGAIVAGGMMLLYGGIFITASLALMAIGAMIATLALPMMLGLSLYGRAGLSANKPKLSFGKVFLILCLIGTAYWLWRGLWFFYGPADVWYRVIPDTAGIVLLVGWCAVLFERQRRRGQA